jgi:hypothetical protein
MRTNFLGLTVFFCIILSGAEIANACTCVRRTTCEFSGGATTVLVGKVLDSKVEQRPFRYSDNPRETTVLGKFQISRVQVKEAFLGLENETEIFIETDNFSSCFYSLETGVEYVIYANKDAKTGKYSTGFCSGTKPVQAGVEDLEYLRAAKNARGSSVKGFVAFSAKTKEHLFEIPEDNFATISKFGITMLVLSNKTAKYTAAIDENSRYEFQNIPPGKYNLSVRLPEGFRTLDDYSPAVAKEFGIELGAVELTGFGCHVSNFTVVKTATGKKRRK